MMAGGSFIETNQSNEVFGINNDDYWVSKNILLKNYQIKLIEEAKKRNTIIYLPTGAGKTLIAVHVLCSKTKEVNRPLTKGGKRAFFVSPTKVLSVQLAKVLKTHTKFKVAEFNGDMNVDLWSRQKWFSHFEENEVIVITGEILRQLLITEFIKLSDICFIVFDECHHAVADHPFSKILEFISKSNVSNKPLLLGLTSVLLNSTPKKEQVHQIIQSLESLFSGKIVTESELDKLIMLSSNLTEQTISFPTVDSLIIKPFLEVYENIINVLENLVLPKNYSIPKEGKEFKCTNKVKRIKNGIVQAQKHLKEFGVFGGSLSALFLIILFEKYRLTSESEKEIHILVYVRTELNKIRRGMVKLMGEEENSKMIFKFSSPKIRKLLYIIIDNHNKIKQNTTLVFVHQRSTAVVLAFLLKRLSAVDEKFSFIKADFVVGSALKSKEYFHNAKVDEIIKQFACQSLNVLIATNMLEEGIDISACNTVISFDFPVHYPSYFQSKGRARDKNSTYYVFMEDSELTKKEEILDTYRKIGKELIENICNNFEDLSEDDTKGDVKNLCFPGKTRIITVDAITAIKVIFRYCSLLPQDKFSLLSPTTWYIVNEFNNKKKAFVQLPLNCPLHDIIEGDWEDNKKLAKRSAFLFTLKKLHDIGELNDDLDINSFEVKNNFNALFPNYKTEMVDQSLPQPGTKKRKQMYKMKFAECLSNCLIEPGKKVYLHVIELTLTFEKPELPRKVAIYDILRLPNTFALLSSKKLPKILQFPLFLDMGQINCNFLVNYDEIILTKSEINDIKMCHITVFQKVLRIMKNSQVFDNRNKEHSFFVAPVKKNEEGRYILSWDCIRLDICKNNNSAVVRYNPTSRFGRESNSDLAKCEKSVARNEISGSLVPGKLVWGFREFNNSRDIKFEFTEGVYKYFIIMPNYRSIFPPQCYILSKFCYDMSPLSPFPREPYSDFFQYYKEKYSIEITNPKQPLLKVSPLFHCSNFNRPAFRKFQRKKEKQKEYEEHLIPELCDVILFDKIYWIKALLLPTALNRISHVYCVEEFRRKIIAETGLGMCELPEGVDWKPLKMDDVFEDEDEKGGNESFQNFPIFQGNFILPLSKLKDKTQMNNDAILDSERYMYDIGLCDLEYYVRHMKEMEIEEEEKQSCEEVNIEITKLISMRNIEIPFLKTLQCKKNSLGPDLAQLIQTCTAKSANDIINYERLETLGDSFLKFAATLFLFRNYSDNEGILSAVKGKIIGNRNLMYCGLQKGIQDVINVTDFAPVSDWNPPLLCIPERLVDGILGESSDPAVLYRFQIPSEEQFSGIVSEETFQKNEEFIRNHNRCWEMQLNCLLPYKTIEDKTIADCVEAFIGVYVKTLGLFGGFEFLLWLGVLPRPEGSYSELIEKPYKAMLLKPVGKSAVVNLLSEVFYWDLENILDYHFKDKALLLEALSHPSYFRNSITPCYQRLELLGDAVIDFLITIYVYENCGHLTPGQITDIRSSLVNNITFACLSVRYEFYKYMLSFSSPLTKVIERFVSFQISRNHVVDDNVLILLDENDHMVGESILVPKALGDLFESLAGAIYLDSGNSLETVWKIYYRLMKREIDEFTKNVPKTAVRLLQEICGEKPYYETRSIRGVTEVSCSVYYEGQEIKAYGLGPSKKEGKRSAAKLTLDKILSLKK